MHDKALKRFRRFKEVFISADIPNDVLMELIESYITSNDEELAAPEIPILDGQLSLYDMVA